LLLSEFRAALPLELLYAHDMVVIAETEDDLIKWLNEWKNNVENRGMRVNMNITKVMISGKCRLQDGHVVTAVKVLVIIQYSQKWVHKKCSGIKVAYSN